MAYPHDIVHGDVLSDSDDERDLRFNSFLNGGCSLRRCDVDTSRVWLQLLHGLPYGTNNRKAQVFLSVLLWVGSTDDICPPCDRLLCIGCSKLTREALKYDTGVASNFKVLNGVIVAIAS